MNANTREVLGRLARWVLLASCAFAGCAAVVAVLAGAGSTWPAGRAWTVTPDVVSRASGYLRLRVFSDPPLLSNSTGFYWRTPDGRLRDLPVGRNGTGYLRLPADTQPGTMLMRTVPNPYGPHAPGADCVAQLLAHRSEMVLLDARCVLSLEADGRLADDAERRWTETSGAAPLVALADRGPLAYVVPLPLADYRRARQILQRAPAAAVLAGGSRWDAPAAGEDVTNLVGTVRKRLGRTPVLITSDAALAADVAAPNVQVILLADTPQPKIQGVVSLRSSDLMAHLRRR